MRKTAAGLIVTLLGIGAVSNGVAQTERSGVGIRVGAGTDVSLGVAYGGEINYTTVTGANAFELGLTVFAGRSTEEDISFGGCCSYTEQTDIVVAAALANYLFSYAWDRKGPYFVAGVGVGAISVTWREESPDDTSLGPPLPGGGSVDEDDGGAGGLIANFGIGQRLSRQVDLRLQVPTFFILSDAPGENTTIPTFTASLGIRF